MMFRRAYLIFGLLTLLTLVPVRAQDDLPPPLCFASLNEYVDKYHTYDFATNTIRTIERDLPLGEVIHYGSDLPPDRVAYQSPYDMTVNFEFVATTPIEPNTHID